MRWIALVLLVGCAGARVQGADGRRYSAWAIGAGHAVAGECDLVSSDKVDRAEHEDHRETHSVVNDGTPCATADGGAGSPGIYAMLAGAFAALFALLSL